MTERHLDSDLILDLVHGRPVAQPADEAHLQGCAECRAEWELVRATARLGSGPLAPLDSRRVAEAVRARLATAPIRHRVRWHLPLAAAAVLFLTVWLARPTAVDPESAVAGGAAAMVLHELDSLDVVQLEMVLETIPPDEARARSIELLPLGDLTADDLERVLRSMEEQ